MHRKKKEGMYEAIQDFGNTVLAATVYDCFTFKSFDPSFRSPGPFSATGTENCVVILVCNTKNWGKKAYSA